VKFKVPDYANDPRHAYAINTHMEQMACGERYNDELNCKGTQSTA